MLADGNSRENSHVIQLTGTIFKLNSRIKETHVLTKFHENLAKNLTLRVITFFHYIHIEKNSPPTGGHVFSPIWTIFELVQDINKSTAFRVPRSAAKASRRLRRTTDELAMTKARVFSENSLANKTTVLTNFHDDWEKIVTFRVFTRKTAIPTGGHVFQRTGTTFELNQHIITTTILTKLHGDWALNVTSTVFTSFELDQDIIGTNLLTKVFTNKCGRTDRRRAKTGHKSSPEQSGKQTCTTCGNMYVFQHNRTNTQRKFHDDWT
ncbi:hypothetical protein DPMN_019021 [Dreissena polymorpha]|uniref:Uncharacterized protein n=1 Tax=Dreissena polymorpha TaxID=45954 RepID=A0A9D4NE96_DREPO|nr:hypothetical protein DPMN_019021 [Dreissena polymorpha]